MCVLRPEDDGFSVLMVHRGTAPFAPEMWVFPGGKLEEPDRGAAAAAVVPDGRLAPELLPAIRCAIRETFEEAGVLVGAQGGLVSSLDLDADPDPAQFWATLSEAGIVLDTTEVAYLSNWVTPAISPLRFDTRFFIALVDSGTEAVPQPSEMLDAVWVTPSDALTRHHDREWPMILPTIKHLELLAASKDAAQLFDHISRSEVVAVHPRPVREGDGWRFILPGETGYDAAG
jgi:recombination protein RecT